jgi:O-succinylbenzoate synthase
VDHPLLPHDGALDVTQALALRPDPARLAATAADAETVARWSARIDAVRAVAA